MNLFSHQYVVLKDTEQYNRVAYYLDMGLGKTFVGSEKLIRLGESVNLIICQKSKVNDWVEHFNKQYEHIQVLNLTDKKQFAAFEFANLSACAMVVGIINYELAWRRKQLLQYASYQYDRDQQPH